MKIIYRTATILIILIVLFMLFNAQNMKKVYKREVLTGIERTKNYNQEVLNENDIQHLPPIVQKYLNYVGVIGKEKVINFRVEFDGVIRSNPDDPWMKLKSVQYNFADRPTRIFYITAKKMGIPAMGIHLYKNETAIMIIKLLGLFTVADARGPEMNQGETVTLFNDMCFMAPATLIDKNIQWDTIDPLTINARFTNGKIRIWATLFFNEKGELINFISNDRFETKDGKTYKNYPWVTPVIDGYENINGYRLAKGAQAIYQRPDGEFCYGEFRIKNIEYNCKEMK